MHPDWAQQLTELGATHVWWDVSLPHLSQWAHQERISVVDGLTTGVEVLARLMNIPPIEPLLAPPGAFPHSPDLRAAHPSGNKMLDRVRALLAKAESSEFPEEADALIGKVQELMTRHSIDHAMVHSTTDADVPIRRRIPVDDPYSSQKATLVAVTARANGCRTVWLKDVGLTTIVGFADDLESVEVLYTSLLVQATTEMAAQSTQGAAGSQSSKSFRQSFLEGFAHRIDQRLSAARDMATNKAEATHGAGVGLVLAGRDKAVDETVNRSFPHLRTKRVRVSSYDGFAAGQAAADEATLGAHNRLEP